MSRHLFLLAATAVLVFGPRAKSAQPPRSRPAETGMEIIGHRGASYDAPENTLASVDLAWEQGADAVEIDVRLTSDGKTVAVHDKTTKRTAGGRDVPVAEQTLDELRRLDAGRWKHEKYAGERIPTLAEILDTIPAGKRLFIEIKSGPEIVPELARVLKDHDAAPEQTPLISFSREVLALAKRELPDRRAYWIVELKRDPRSGAWTPAAGDLAREAAAAGFDGVDVGKDPEIDEAYVMPLRAAGLELYVWTVNAPESARRFRRLGFDGITTDRPGWLREQIESGP